MEHMHTEKSESVYMYCYIPGLGVLLQVDADGFI